MQRKRRGLKKEKEKQEAAEKAEDTPGTLSSFCSASFFPKIKPCLHARCGPKAPWTPKRDEVPEKKKRSKKRRKDRCLCPWPLSVFCSSFFFEKRTRTPFPHVRRVEDPPGLLSALCSASFSPKRKPCLHARSGAKTPRDAKGMKNKKERQKQRKSRESVSLNVISLLFFLFL